MLALGDSVVFGYITQDGFAYVNPDNFLGYPELVGSALRLSATKASCPGETTAGFLSLTGANRADRCTEQHLGGSGSGQRRRRR